MQHSTMDKIKRSYLPILVLSIIGILMGGCISLLFAINPTPDYEDMLETTITVDSIQYISRYRGGGGYVLKTIDGELYNLAGDFHISDLQSHLHEGTEIQIKWYSKTWLFQKKLYIEEIKLQNELFSTYTNHDRESMIFGFAAGSLCIGMGIVGILFYRHFVHKEIAKLPKKYRK